MKALVLIFSVAASVALGEVREIRQGPYRLPPVVDTPETLAVRAEGKARRAALAERNRALLELAGIVADGKPVTTSAGISNQVARIRERGAAMQGLSAVIADTRASIPETSGMNDSEIAGLYLKQMSKNAGSLLEAAGTNSLEYIIGAGMRQDIKNGKGK